MHTRPLIAAACLTAALAARPALLPSQPTEPMDAPTLARIREEGLQRSQVMDHLSWLTDVYGPRLTGSPTIRQAADWAESRLRGWGLAAVHEEPWAFGKGWSLVRFSAHLVVPQVQPLIGLPKAWTPGTNGPVTADVVLAPVRTEGDLAKYRGKLRGKIVLTQPARAVRMLDGRIVLRMTPEEIREAESVPRPTPPTERGARGDTLPQRRIQDFYRAEGVLALLDRGSDADSAAGGSDLSWYTQRTDGGTIFVQSGGARDSTAGRGLPQVTLAVEHYNRMVRILEKGVPVRVELNVQTRFYDETTPRGFNIVAELPGTDPALAGEVVMIGAHFDSWHGGTGATDDAAGSAAMMEAMRILKAVGVHPRRTIRLALWGGEEEGLLGSSAYARAHFGDPATMRLLPEHARLSAYYNIDNGTGRIRGIWLQSNPAVRPIFAQWIAPLADLGVTILGPRSVSSTDHVSFDTLGLPAFQFVQERLEYNSRSHHSNMDVYDRLQPDDMKQMAIVVATFAYLTAQRDEKLPRKPLPAARDTR